MTRSSAGASLQFPRGARAVLALAAAAALIACATKPAPAPETATLVVVTQEQLASDAAAQPGPARLEALGPATAGAKGFRVDQLTLPPGAVSPAHHHGDQETGVYIVRGHALTRWGVQLEHETPAGPGDYIFIPPHLPHQETNASDTEPLTAVVIRSGPEPVMVPVALEASCHDE